MFHRAKNHVQRSFVPAGTCLAALVLLGASRAPAGSPQGQGGGHGKDTTPPAAVTDLQAAPSAQDSILLTWTAVGDDGGAPDCSGAGIATSYDVRIDTVPILDDAAFAAAAQLPAGEPRRCGQTETLCVDGLASGMDYFFALKVADEKDNQSGISNPAMSAPGTSQGAFVHVLDVNVSWTIAGRSRPAEAVVTVVDENGAPVANATVVGEWTGCNFSGQSATAVTDCAGRAVFGRKANCSNPCEFGFTVIAVGHDALLYDPAADVEVGDSIFCL